MEASIFDDSTNLGPKVNVDLATRVNDSFTKKPLEDKMKAIVGHTKPQRIAICFVSRGLMKHCGAIWRSRLKAATLPCKTCRNACTAVN